MKTKCIKCKEVINPLRIKALPKTRVCVECSNVQGYKAEITTNGEGDHTWNDIIIIKDDK